MVITKTVEIGAQTFTVKHGDEVSKDLESKNCFGDMSTSLSRIRIDDRYPPDLVTEVLLHEIIEAVNVNYLDGELNHKQITALGQGISQALKSMGAQFTSWEE